MLEAMFRQLELVVLSTGIGYLCYSFMPVWYPGNLLYLGFLLLYVILAGTAQQHVLSDASQQLFKKSDPGLLYCLLLPLTSCRWTDYEGRLLISLIPVTLFLYVKDCKRIWSSSLLLSVLPSCLIFHIDVFSFSWMETNFSVILCLIYTLLFKSLPVCFATSFSVGELSIVCEIYIFILSGVLQHIVSKQEVLVIEKLVSAIFIMINVVLALMWVLQWLRATLTQTVTSTLLVGMASLLCVLRWIVSPIDIKAFLQQLFESHVSVILLLWWIFCTVISILIVCYYGNRTEKFKASSYRKGSGASSVKNVNDGNNIHLPHVNITEKDTDSENIFFDRAEKKIRTKGYTESESGVFNEKEGPESSMETLHCKYASKLEESKDNFASVREALNRGEAPMFVRKYFHVVIICVYLPGMIYNHRLLYLASFTAMAVFFLIEAVRVLDFLSLGSYLNKYLMVFLDKQDQGTLILTPIYLLIGCSLPLWLIRPKLEYSLSIVHYSGLLSVGVGDAAASICGRKFGRWRWPGSKKTVEGTLAAILAQLACLPILKYIGVSGADITFPTVIVLLLVSSLEAVTQHIDNLVMPVYALLLFSTIDRQSSSVWWSTY